MIEHSTSPPLRLLQAAAYVVVVAWGIKAAVPPPLGCPDSAAADLRYPSLSEVVNAPVPASQELGNYFDRGFCAHDLSGHIRCLGRGRLSTA